MSTNKLFKVYIHTFKTSGKSYIGYTHYTVAERLHKHYLNAISGIDSKFYRAIRKYGLIDIKTRILLECDTQDAATQSEVFYIKKYDTFKHGYNMTLGGDGGNVCKMLSPKKLKRYLKLRSEATIGHKNPNYSGFTDSEIIEEAVRFYNKCESFSIKKWTKHSKNIGLPQIYTKFRFNGKGIEGFKELLSSELGVTINELEYKVDSNHKRKLSNVFKKRRKVNKKGIWTIIHKKDLNEFLKKGWTRGRGKLTNIYQGRKNA
jgi:hypothetical protein